MHVVLSSKSDNIHVIEGKIVTEVDEIRAVDTEQLKDSILAYKAKELKQLLRELDVPLSKFLAMISESIMAYFICESEKHLHQLRGHYKTGLMKDVLERIFCLLAGEQVNIVQLQWTDEEYTETWRLFDEVPSMKINPIFFNKFRFILFSEETL